MMIKGCEVVAYRVSNVNVGTIWQLRDCRIQVDNVAGFVVHVKVAVDALNESGLA